MSSPLISLLFDIYQDETKRIAITECDESQSIFCNMTIQSLLGLPAVINQIIGGEDSNTGRAYIFGFTKHLFGYKTIM
jgi:hypothetical protein